MNFLAEQFSDVAKESGSIKIDELSSLTNYYGFSLNQDAKTSDPLWRIFRLQKIGAVTSISDANGGKANQIWDNRNDGIIFPPPPSYSTKAFLFDGSNEYLEGDDSEDFNLGDTCSISCWIKTTDVKGDIISQFDAASPFIGFSFGLGAITDGKLHWYSAATEVQSFVGDTGSVINDGQWHNVIAVLNTNSVIFYVDGESTSTSAVVEGIGNSTNKINIARDTNSSPIRYLSATLTGCALWDKSLTPDEISEMYNGGKTSDLLLHSAESNLVAFWTLGDDPLDDATADTGNIQDLKSTHHLVPKNTEVGDIVVDAP